MEKPTKLYKYYRNKNYVFNTITNGQLYFSTADKFNDPYDCYIGINKREFYKKYFLSLLKENNLNKFYKDFLENYYDNTVRKELQFNAVEDFVMINTRNDNNPVLNQLLNKVEKRYISYAKQIHKLKRSLYICCFSNTDIESSIQMWAYYANNYNGYCCTYQLDTNTKSKKHNTLAKMFYDHLYPINYTEKLINVDIDQLLMLEPRHLNESTYIKELVFLASQSKYKKWENESEYRLIFDKEDFINNGGDINTGLINFPFLSQLTLGRDIPKEKQRQFLEKLKDVEINRISYSYHEYKLGQDWDNESILHNLKVKLRIDED